MAKLFIGLYPDLTAADAVVYDLVKNGVSRHTIGLATHDGVEVKPGSLSRAVVEGAVKEHRAQIEQGRVLIVAWAFGRWVKDAEKIMKNHNPLAFESRRAT